MMPHPTPAYWISACCPSWAIWTSSRGRFKSDSEALLRSADRNPLRVATSNAALRDKPDPMGTDDVTYRLMGGYSKPLLL